MTVVATSETIAQVRQIIGSPLSDAEAGGLAEWYAALSRGVAAFPESDLKRVEPPLRSVPGPRRR